jgi:hypothetical protein
MKIRSITAYAALVFTLLAAGSRPATAATISVGTFDPSTSPFVVPIEITGAVELINWQFDLAFDPTLVQIHEFCDPFADAFCDLLTGPVTEGPFTAGPFSLFVPGVIDNASGLLSLVAGAYGDPPPGPSGDGTLANVLFVSIGEGDPNIRVVDSLVPPSVPEPGISVLLLTSGLVVPRARRRARLRRAALENPFQMETQP